MALGTLTFDIDGTICTQEKDYAEAIPNWNIINKINDKYDEGYSIILYTARGTMTGIDWTDLTEEQLEKWGVKYHRLIFGKPAGDLYIDDKAINVLNWEPQIQFQAIVDKPWGREYLLTKNNKYAFKRLEIRKGRNISKQFHKEKHETWHIIEGKGLAYVDGQCYEVTPGMTIDIPPLTIHQLKADDNFNLVLIEASTPELNDIVRMEREFNVYNS